MKMTSLFDPDDFTGDWYGWMTNQASHIGLGVLLTFFLCVGLFLTFGEMPYKIAVLAVIATGYLAFEFGVQRWRGWDTIEDTVFVVGYGASGALVGFSEVTPGSAQLSVNLVDLLPYFAVASVHLLAGSLYRRQSVLAD